MYKSIKQYLKKVSITLNFISISIPKTKFKLLSSLLSEHYVETFSGSHMTLEKKNRTKLMYKFIFCLI